jgi:hypothetical protein
MAANAFRFNFPGFVGTNICDNDRAEIEIGSVTIGKIVYTVRVRRPKEPEGLPFLVERVMLDEKTLFAYEPGSKGYMRLAMAGNELVIGVIGQGFHGKLFQVIDLTNTEGRPTSLNRTIDLKVAAAEFLERDVHWEPRELIARRHLTDRAAAELERVNAAKYAARLAAREKRVTEIMARTVVYGVTAVGGQRYGRPVVGDEWKILPDRTHVVLVESFTNDTPGKLIEAFMVSKDNGGSARKFAAVPVGLKQQTTQLSKAHVVPKRMVCVEIEQEIFEVSIFGSMEDIREARAKGLNGGSYVAVDAAGQITVLSVFKDKIVTVGDFMPLS